MWRPRRPASRRRRRPAGAALVPGALAIVIAGAVVGLLVNLLRPGGLAWVARKRDLQPRPASAQASFISLAEAKAHFDARDALFVDARGPEEYAEGHIPGAVNLMPDDFRATDPSISARLPKGRPIVTYCDGPDCGKSSQLADRLVGAGYSKVSIFVEGWPAWEQAGYPAQRSDDQ